MNYLKQFVISVVLVLVMIIAVRLQITINEKNEEKENLQKIKEELEYENEKLQNTLDAPMDDEYIEKVASDELGYKHSDWQYFYSDTPS